MYVCVCVYDPGAVKPVTAPVEDDGGFFKRVPQSQSQPLQQAFAGSSTSRGGSDRGGAGRGGGASDATLLTEDLSDEDIGSTVGPSSASTGPGRPVASAGGSGGAPGAGLASVVAARGEPISVDVAIALRQLLYGTAYVGPLPSFHKTWLTQVCIEQAGLGRRWRRSLGCGKGVGTS